MYWLYEATNCHLGGSHNDYKETTNIMKGMKNGTHISRLYKPKTNSKYFKFLKVLRFNSIAPYWQENVLVTKARRPQK